MDAFADLITLGVDVHAWLDRWTSIDPDASETVTAAAQAVGASIVPTQVEDWSGWHVDRPPVTAVVIAGIEAADELIAIPGVQPTGISVVEPDRDGRPTALVVSPAASLAILVSASHHAYLRELVVELSSQLAGGASR
jgi:hypothetical protein